ncbi:hypothetical protein HPB51_019504 [Rhipicephalus microplus]|uniref:Uncharacterized protein n=1 Tax=Rhipicephalus microplus TaxID=6941 RepID=A0A9J6EBD3_RHIMP|nr:hypothetical protein HPB51_019504 [Rhipicephalus microplus]
MLATIVASLPCVNMKCKMVMYLYPGTSAMSSVDRVLTLFGYKLDRKLGDFKARLREDRGPENTGANPWNPATMVLDSLRRRKCGFGRLTTKRGSSSGIRRQRSGC